MTNYEDVDLEEDLHPASIHEQDVYVDRKQWTYTLPTQLCILVSLLFTTLLLLFLCGKTIDILKGK